MVVIIELLNIYNRRVLVDDENVVVTLKNKFPNADNLEKNMYSEFDYKLRTHSQNLYCS